MTVVIFDLSTGISEIEDPPETERKTASAEDLICPVRPELSIVETENQKEEHVPIPVLTGMVN